MQNKLAQQKAIGECFVLLVPASVTLGMILSTPTIWVLVAGFLWALLNQADRWRAPREMPPEP